MTDFFAPRVNQDNQAFWEGCRNHELRFQRCKVCGRLRWPAGYVCPHCLSTEVEIATLAPEGTLYSFVVMQKPFHPSVADKVPYIVATVDLTDDIRILANIFDCDPATLHCGDKVTIDFMDSDSYSRPIARKVETEV